MTICAALDEAIACFREEGKVAPHDLKFRMGRGALRALAAAVEADSKLIADPQVRHDPPAYRGITIAIIPFAEGCDWELVAREPT